VRDQAAEVGEHGDGADGGERDERDGFGLGDGHRWAIRERLSQLMRGCDVPLGETPDIRVLHDHRLAVVHHRRERGEDAGDESAAAAGTERGTVRHLSPLSR
jgi:hypothetical protein